MDVLRDINVRYWSEITGYHRLFFVYMGLWPLVDGETNRILKLARCFPVLGLGGLILSVIISIYDMTFKLDNYILISESICSFIALSKSVLIIVLALFKMKDIVEIFTAIESFTPYVCDRTERVLLDRIIRKSRMYAMINVLIWFTFNLSFVFQPLLIGQERRYPLHMTLPLDSPYFEIMYTGVIASSMIINLCLSVFDSVMVSAFIYVSGYIQIVQYKLEHSREISLKKVKMMALLRKAVELLGTFPDGHDQEANVVASLASKNTNMSVASATSLNEVQREITASGITFQPGSSILNTSSVCEERSFDHVELFDEELGEQNIMVTLNEEVEIESTLDVNFKIVKRDLEVEMGRYLGKCVTLHDDLIGVIHKMQSRVDPILFLHLVCGAVTVCLTMFLTTQVPFGSYEMFLWICFLLLDLQELYGYCWVSSELHHESVKVSDALYFSDWTEASPSYKRSMLIIMSRAVSPVELTAGSFLTFNMEMFTNILNSAYSYFNVIYTMQTNN